MKKNDNSGAIFFVPEEERKKETSAHFNGNVDIDGKEWFVVAWVNTYEDKKSGETKKYINLKFNEPKPKEEKSKVVGTIDTPYEEGGMPF